MLAFALCLLTSVADGSAATLPDGHPRLCSFDLKTLGELPGIGYDNLRNTEMGEVTDNKYFLCQTSDDGQFLIPDSVAVIPTKESNIRTETSLFEHWDNYTSTSSKSINFLPGFSMPFWGISGKYSDEYVSTKSTIYFKKAKLMRMQLRHSRYIVHLNLGASLNPVFKRKLEKIAGLLISNRTQRATYESQMLVREYGTHVITRLELGASFVQIDELSQKFEEISASDKRELQNAVDWRFLNLVGTSNSSKANASMYYAYTQAAYEGYLKRYDSMKESTKLYSLGGGIITFGENIGDSWKNSVESNLVALDRSGEPIYMFINDETLPELPYSTIQTLYEFVKQQAVYTYYETNTIRGCTDPKSPNFNFRANFDDGSCQASNYTFSFGGVYQTCQSTGPENMCIGITSVNPLTGTFSCPSKFKPVLINEGKKPKVTTSTRSYSCGFLWLSKCYETVFQWSTASYSAYWCSAFNATSNLLFGGVFTSYSTNLLTEENSCPPFYYPLLILDDLSVCVSQNIDYGKKYSVPFAGFYSCKEGNPLAVQQNQNSSSPYPNGCPDGFSQFLASVDDGCEIDYCIKSSAVKSLHPPRIQLPPYLELPSDKSPFESEKLGLTKNGTITQIFS